MPARTPHEVLGVSQTASFEEIRAAFRKLARQYHPDVNKGKGAYARFKEINEAYEALTRDNPAASGKPEAVYVPVGMDAVFGSVIADVFSSAPSAPRKRKRGQDLRIPLTISSEEAVHGTEKEFEFLCGELCSMCGGSGAKPGTSPVQCGTCAGRGEVRNGRSTEYGRIVTYGTCPDCKGWGEIIPKPCKQCNGTRMEKQKKRLLVHIPAGAKTGTIVRLEGEGEASPSGGERGDLQLMLEIKQV